MNKEKVLSIIECIFQDILDNKGLKINVSDTPEDVENWDSVNNVNIIIALESEFNIKLSMDQITNIKSVGDLLNFVCESKVNSN